MAKQSKDKEPPRSLTADEVIGLFKARGYDFRYNIVTDKDEVIFRTGKIKVPFIQSKVFARDDEPVRRVDPDNARFEDKWTDVEDRTIKFFHRTVAINIFNEHCDPSLSDLKKPKLIQDSIDDYSFRHSYDPFNEYFMDCQIHHMTYGGDPLSELLSYIKVPTSSLEVLNKGLPAWLMGVIATALYPDKLFQNHMLILVGKQGTGKTLFFRSLFKDLYPTYWNESAPSMFEKDVSQKLSSNICWLYDDANFSERSSSIDMLKALLTRGHSNERLAYGQRKVMLKRRTSFAGTTNRMAFLNDSTGDRRFLCLEIESIDIDSIRNKLDIKGLWGQIVTMFYKLNNVVPDVKEIQENSNKQFRGENPLHMAISGVVESTGNPHDKVFLSEITKYLAKREVIPNHRGHASNEVARAFADMSIGKKAESYLTNAKRQSVCFSGVRWRLEINTVDIPDYVEKDHRHPGDPAPERCDVTSPKMPAQEPAKVLPFKKPPWIL